MIYLGWCYEPTKTFKKLQKQIPELNKSMSLPYEILQVWRSHILFTEKYSELCKIVSLNKTDFIPFLPPKQIWKSTPINELQKFFRVNREIVLTFSNKSKFEKEKIDALFIFQSSYLKNYLHFNIEDGSPILNYIIKRYEEELLKPDGIFYIQTRDENSLSALATKIENLIYSSIPIENYPGRTEWVLDSEINDIRSREKLVTFMNLRLPSNFQKNFSCDHLFSEALSETYIDEYRKFLYITNVTGKIQTPSEEVDLVWHYHQEHIKDYLAFSKDTMGKSVFVHMPANGTEEDNTTYQQVYLNTMNSLQKYFGYVNNTAWKPVEIRFNQTFRWYNHLNLIQKCSSWQKNSFTATNSKSTIKNREVINGCYVGCGIIMGRPYVIGCGLFIGCGYYFHGCGILGCGAIYRYVEDVEVVVQ